MYNHKETDEQIFFSLIAAVEKDWRDYSLTRGNLVHKMQLSSSNYGDKVCNSYGYYIFIVCHFMAYNVEQVFIHPPVFVYFSVMLVDVSSYLFNIQLPLPLIPVICHFLTLIFTYFLAMIMFENNVHKRKIATWSVLIISFCPISFFCSQKVITLLYFLL